MEASRRRWRHLGLVEEDLLSAAMTKAQRDNGWEPPQPGKKKIACKKTAKKNKIAMKQQN